MAGKTEKWLIITDHQALFAAVFNNYIAMIAEKTKENINP